METTGGQVMERQWDIHVRTYMRDPGEGRFNWNRVNASLSAWGREGWELVGFGLESGELVCAFKRMKR